MQAFEPSYLGRGMRGEDPDRTLDYVMNGTLINATNGRRPRGVSCGRQVRSNGTGNLDTGHLAAHDENFASSRRSVAEETLQVSVLTAVDDRNSRGRGYRNTIGHDRSSEVPRRNDDMIESPSLLLALGLERHIPGRGAALAKKLRPSDSSIQVQAEVLI